MDLTKFEIAVSRQQDRLTLMESDLLEMLERADRAVDAAEHGKEVSDRIVANFEDQLDSTDPVVRRRARKSLREIKQKLANAEQHGQNSWQTVKRHVLVYLAEKKRFESQKFAALANSEPAQEAVQESGPGLFGQLGMALLAWKASNAFDDLAKLSGRKK